MQWSFKNKILLPAMLSGLNETENMITWHSVQHKAGPYNCEFPHEVRKDLNLS